MDLRQFLICEIFCLSSRNQNLPTEVFCRDTFLVFLWHDKLHLLSSKSVLGNGPTIQNISVKTQDINLGMCLIKNVILTAISTCRSLIFVSWVLRTIYKTLRESNPLPSSGTLAQGCTFFQKVLQHLQTKKDYLPFLTLGLWPLFLWAAMLRMNVRLSAEVE